MTDKPIKVYIHGRVGREKDIEKLFESVGVKNTFNYKFGNPAEIYFVDKNGNISIAEPDSDLHYVIENSGDWRELKLKEPKKERKFIVTVREGSSSCDGCSVYNKCSDEQRSKCQLAKHLNDIFQGSEMTGKCLDIVEIDTTFKPVTPYTNEDF